MAKIFIFLLCLPCLIYSQNFDRRFSRDFIEKMDTKFNVKFGFDNDIESFEYNKEDLQYSIEPNINYKIRLAVNYRMLAFKIGYTPTFFGNKDSDKKGETKVFKIGSDLFMGKWMHTLEYYKIKGYYVLNLRNEDGFIPGFDEYIILPDLQNKSLGFATRYIFNDRYSLKSNINQTEIQLKSAGSFVPGFAAKYTKISDGSVNSDIDIFGLTANAGYYYNFVLNSSWFISMALAPGLGYEWTDSKTIGDSGTVNDSHNDFVATLFTNLGMGYNSENFFGGFQFNGNYLGRDENPIMDLNTSRSTFQMYVGYRFRAPNFVKKNVDWLGYNSVKN